MATGTRYSYTDTGNTKRSISDVVNMIDWTEAPLLRIFGFSSKNVKKFNIANWPATKVELLEDTMPGFTSTLSGSHNNSTTTINVAASTGQYFRQGDIILVNNSEKMLVTSVATDALTVATRPYGSTSAASYTGGESVVITTRAMPESANFTTGYTTTTTQPYNYTQIISEAVQVSKTAQAIQTYGIDDLMDYEVSKLFADDGSSGRLAQFLQRTFYYGERVQRSGSAYGSMGGFKTFVTTNKYDLAGATITRDRIHTAIRDVRQAGGKVTHLITGSWGIEKITSMYEGMIETTRDETIGGAEISTIMTPHGKVKVVYDWMCPTGEYYFPNAAKVGWLPLRPFDSSDIAQQGDFYVSDVVGEFTFLVANEKSHAYIFNAADGK